jgi:hypothetical protein
MFNNLRGFKPADCSNLFFAKLNSLAIKCSLIVHRSRKFSAEGFLLTLYKAILSGKSSFNEMADRLGGFEPLKMSKQALWKRINPQAIAFLLESLATSLQLKTLNDFKLPNALRGRFSRILVEDSTTHRLHHSNSDHSPGHGNGRSKTSLLKVDVTLDLISGSCVQNSLHSGTQQDKEIGKDLVDLVQEGDLVLRDMGYFIIAEFVLIAKLLASWLSRVPANVVITNHSGYRIEKILRACKNDLWDGEILLGEEEKHRCRLIAVRASPEVVRRNLKDARERAASRGKTLSKAKRERLHWHLLVTNLTASELRVREAGELYRCRWKIEILFRAWKQGMNIKPALNRRSNALHHQALILAAMIYQVLTLVIMILWKPLMRKREEVSVEKSFSVMSNHVLGLKDLREFFDLSPDRRHIRMDPHNKRESLADLWLQLKS